MKVWLLQPDPTACGHYRMRLPRQHLEDEIWFVDNQRLLITWNRSTRLPTDVEVPVGLDVLVMQRPMKPLALALMHCFQRKGVACVVELDDDMRSVPRENRAWPAVHGKQGHDTHFRWLVQCCAEADLVTCSTKALAERYAPHGRVAVLPNCVPEALLAVHASRRDDVVGWAGHSATHPHDLETTGGSVASAVEDAEAQFKVIGDTTDAPRNRLGLLNDPMKREWLPLNAYYNELATLTVGIVPLAPTRFNDAKSNLKGLEMAALGVPFIASPTVEYRRLHKQGAGVLAPDPFFWHTLLRRLLRDPSRREVLAESGKDTIYDLYTIEGNKHLWPEAWTEAIHHRKRRRLRRVA